MSNDSIKVAFALDNNCFQFALVAMVSIMENTKENVEFLILHSALFEGVFNALKTVEKYPNCKVIFKEIDEKIFEGFQTASWTPVQAWFRVLVPDLFCDLEKILYLDCDILALKDIKELWEINLENHLAAAVQDVMGSNFSAVYLGLKSKTYFNSGVMVLNCEKWRKEKMFEKIEDCAKNNPYIKYGDQDVLNAVIDEDKILISPKFNYIQKWDKDFANEYEGEFLKDYEKSMKEASIAHFAGFKPTIPGCGNTYAKAWWQYAEKTPLYIGLLENYKESADKYIYKLQFANMVSKNPS